MKRVALVLGLALACTCAYPAGAPDPNLHHLMKDVIAVQAQVIWDIGNHAQGDRGDIDTSKVTPASWKKMADAATQVKRAAQTLVNASHVTAAAPGQKLEDEDEPGAFKASDVQKAINAQPKALSAMAQALANSMDQLQTAIFKRDGHKLGEISGDLDEVCEACHKVFWYPNEH